MGSQTSQRIAFWDNAKAILILLVVIGHFLLPISPKGTIVFSTYTWIYLFHMPAFVFVSGYFSKQYVAKGASDVKRLIGFLVLYLLFSVAIWIIRMVCNRDISMIFIFTPSGAPWYLMCMFIWYCIIPYCDKIRPIIMMALSMLAGLLIGLEWQAGDFLALSRCFVFFPFFVLGYHFDYKLITGAKPYKRIISGILLIAVFIAICLFPDFFVKHTNVMYGDSAYTRFASGLFERFIWYISAMIIVLAFLHVIPQKRCFFTYIGQRTMVIYIIHRLIRDICQYLGFYKILPSDFWALVICIAFSAVITFLLSAKGLTDLFNKVFNARYSLLLKERN